MRFSARLVMVAYTLLLLKPAMPVIVDNMEHSFNAAEHFEVVHSHGGKDHVHYWMEKNARNGGQDKTGLHNHISEEMPVHLAVHAIFEVRTLCSITEESKLFFYQRSHEDVRDDPDFPPPKTA